MTECTLATHFTPREVRRYGSVGKVMPFYEAKVPAFCIRLSLNLANLAINYGHSQTFLSSPLCIIEAVVLITVLRFYQLELSSVIKNEINCVRLNLGIYQFSTSFIFMLYANVKLIIDGPVHLIEINNLVLAIAYSKMSRCIFYQIFTKLTLNVIYGNILG